MGVLTRVVRTSDSFFVSGSLPFDNRVSVCLRPPVRPRVWVLTLHVSLPKLPGRLRRRQERSRGLRGEDRVRTGRSGRISRNGVSGPGDFGVRNRIKRG